MKPGCSISSANRLRKTDTASGAVDYTLGLGDRLASFTGGAYDFNPAGCVTNISGGASSPSEPLSRALAWNSQYQLLSVSTNGVLAESYTWDPLGRRASTTTSEGTIHHVYDGDECIADLDESGAVVRSYVWGPGIDNLLAVRTGGATYYALTDHQNTVHGFVDASGALVAHYVYDAWGNVLESSVSVPALANNRYLFQGREYSWATGLYNFRARWYDPATGRWLSKDPIGISGGMNLHEFCGNSPLVSSDPHGCCGLKTSSNTLTIGVRAAALVGIEGEIGIAWDSGGRFGIVAKVGGGFGVEAGAQLPGISSAFKGSTGKFVSNLGASGGIGSGTIYELSKWGVESHCGFFAGFSSDILNDGKINGLELGGIGGGVYGHRTQVIPLWDPAWKEPIKEFVAPIVDFFTPAGPEHWVDDWE